MRPTAAYVCVQINETVDARKVSSSSFFITKSPFLTVEYEYSL